MSDQDSIIDPNPSIVSTVDYVFLFGEYLIDPNTKSLMRQGNEVTVEPKVLDVLIYLCENANRFILLQEFHDNVWQGRIVSDAAVRRSISKLRAIFSVNTPDEYIQSQHKKGYKLVVDLVKQVKNELSSSVNSPSNTPVVEYRTTSSRNANKNILRVFLAAFVVFSLLFLAYYQQNNSLHLEEVLEFPGEKIHISTSENLVAFAGKVFDFQGFQLFIGDKTTNKVRQLTDNESNVLRVNLGPNEQFVYYIEMVLGQSKIKRISLKESAQKEILIDDFFIMSDLSIQQNNKGFYFCGIKTKGQQSQVYYYEFKNQQYYSITTQYNTGQHDYRVTVSDDGELFAVATSLGRVRDQEITIYNTNNQSINKRILHEQPVFDLFFYDSNKLAVIDKKQLLELNIVSGVSRKLLNNEEYRIVSVDRDESGDVFALQKYHQDDIYIEISSPSFAVNSQKVIASADKSVHQMKFYNDKSYLLVKKQQDQYHLFKVDHQNKSEVLIFKTSMAMKVITVGQNSVLLYLDGLLSLLRIDSGNIDYISKGGDVLFIDTTFSLDENTVFYGVKSGNSWDLFQYNVNNKKSELFLAGFKAIQQTGHGDYFIDASGQLFHKPNQGHLITSLSEKVKSSISSQWFVRGGNILWSEFDGKNIIFNVFNISKNSLKLHKFNQSFVKAQFDVNSDGSSALLIRKKLPETKMVQVSLPVE